MSRIVIFSISLFLTACGDLCGNDPLNVAKSPDGKLEAISFVRSCGATTGFSTHVSIIPVRSNLPNDPGNVLVLSGEHPVVAEWQGNTKLLILGFVGVKPVKFNSDVNHVQVVYSEHDSQQTR